MRHKFEVFKNARVAGLTDSPLCHKAHLINRNHGVKNNARVTIISRHPDCPALAVMRLSTELLI